MVKQKKNKEMKCGEGDCKCDCNGKSGCGLSCHKGCGGAVYGLGFVGAVIYYIATATGFWSGVLGILKAIVWPVFVVMKILGL